MKYFHGFFLTGRSSSSNHFVYKISIFPIDRVLPICLPIHDDELLERRFTERIPFVAGWGDLTEGGRAAAILQQVQIPLIPNEKCKERYEVLDQVATDKQFDDRVVCAGRWAGGIDSCQGDSGGPMFLALRNRHDRHFSFYQIGIVSWGEGCVKETIIDYLLSIIIFFYYIIYYILGSTKDTRYLCECPILRRLD